MIVMQSHVAQISFSKIKVREINEHVGFYICSNEFVRSYFACQMYVDLNWWQLMCYAYLEKRQS